MSSLAKKELAKQERRAEIIAAAVQVFFERGVHGATMDDIARAAELSKGTLYLYFTSKDELFLSVALSWLHDLERLLEERRTQPHKDGLEELRVIAKTYASHATEAHGRFQVAMSWMNSPYQVDGKSPLFGKYREAIARNYQRVSQAIERGLKDGSIRSSTPVPSLALQLWGGTLGVILVEQNSQEMARRLPVLSPTEGLCSAFIDSFLSGLSCEASRPSFQESKS